MKKVEQNLEQSTVASSKNREKLEKIRAEHQLELILLYGSQADNTIHAESDIDIAVVSKIDFDYLGLHKDISMALSTNKLDLVDITHADPLFLMKATQQALLLAGDAQQFAALQLKAFNLYQDYQPYLQLKSELLTERLGRYGANYSTSS